MKRSNEFRIVSNCLGRQILALLALGLAGCGGSGPPLVPVTGKVIKDGETLSNVTVTFVPEGVGVPALGANSSSGTITMKTDGRQGVVVGKYKVGISEPLRPMTPESRKSGAPPPMSFDQKFRSAATSGIEFDVPAGGATFEFTVTKATK